MSHISGHIIHLFSTSSFFFLNFYYLYFLFKKKKTILHYISPCLLLCFLQLFPSLFCLFISHYFYFTVTLLSSFFTFLYFDFFFLPFLFCINSISFLSSNPYFSYKKTEYSLSLSIFFWWILFFLITLIKFDGFFFNKYVFWYCVFLISHHKVFSLPFIVLVEFWFRLILSFFKKKKKI